jgi:hypothetical protein
MIGSRVWHTPIIPIGWKHGSTTVKGAFEERPYNNHARETGAKVLFISL